MAIDPTFIFYGCLVDVEFLMPKAIYFPFDSDTGTDPDMS
jgi:hypothetical protein